MPDRSPGVTPTGAPILSGEDSIGKTLFRRLKGADADMERIGVLAEPMTLPDDLSVGNETRQAVPLQRLTKPLRRIDIRDARREFWSTEKWIRSARGASLSCRLEPAFAKPTSLTEMFEGESDTE